MADYIKSSNISSKIRKQSDKKIKCKKKFLYYVLSHFTKNGNISKLQRGQKNFSILCFIAPFFFWHAVFRIYLCAVNVVLNF
jgi:hypothetical protein